MLHDVPVSSETLEQIIEGQWFTQAPRLSYRAHTLSGESLQGSR